MNFEQFEELGRQRIVREDLFTFPNIVIPIKTLGRWYGSISRAVAGKVDFPHLSLCGAKVVPHGEKNFIFVALWDDHTPYSNRLISSCMASAYLASARAGLEKIATPLLGGKEGQKYIGAMEQALDETETKLEAMDISAPEVVFVTR
jgi:hypothetical protein